MLDKQARRAARELELAAATEAAARRLGTIVYGIVYLDPAWRWEPRSRITGMDRSPENHYPCPPLDVIRALKPPVGPNGAIFLWVTAPLLDQGIAMLKDWGFSYRTNWIWVKPSIGLGYWNRNQHDQLLLGIRGHVPAPVPGTQLPSVVMAPRGRHSEKPEVFAAMIERMFPNTPKLEMYARRPREGWHSWGNEI